MSDTVSNVIVVDEGEENGKRGYYGLENGQKGFYEKGYLTASVRSGKIHVLNMKLHAVTEQLEYT